MTRKIGVAEKQLRLELDDVYEKIGQLEARGREVEKLIGELAVPFKVGERIICRNLHSQRGPFEIIEILDDSNVRARNVRKDGSLGATRNVWSHDWSRWGRT